ncbi:MAG: hypothetical protein F9K13_02575 [Candidatus Methylomirabilis oxygeniifera]|uniref:Uncharacterized protein n=1 Tax=Methylomirabilis oxygeniifera TaxID=671143 RepID=D5MF38_METO1|nr:MAG: hypothetical protein F9K13_02575 [Candidatus Methylomirabilis oxyfera]CBE68367.1 protein of unknown function [Candidatus Methylomirabilis oxyfera]
MRIICTVRFCAPSGLGLDERGAGGGVTGMTLVRTALAGRVGEVSTSPGANAPSVIASTPIPTHRVVRRSDQPAGEQLRQL